MGQSIGYEADTYMERSSDRRRRFLGKYIYAMILKILSHVTQLPTTLFHCIRRNYDLFLSYIKCGNNINNFP